jgi:hypothetical protein
VSSRDVTEPETDTETDNPTPTPPPPIAVTDLPDVEGYPYDDVVLEYPPRQGIRYTATIDPVQLEHLRAARGDVFTPKSPRMPDTTQASAHLPSHTSGTPQTQPEGREG